jgi:aspartate/methionine/tyrosine aminotransferase
MAFDAEYYNHMLLDYRARRDMMCGALQEAGFRFTAPEGAYYILADYSQMSDVSDREFAIWLTREGGVATVPGSSFLATPGTNPSYVRFAFCKKTETLEAAAARLVRLPERV